MIEELPVFPVDFDRHMRAAVEIGIRPAAETNRECRLVRTVTGNGESQSAAAIGQIGRGADQAFVRSHACSARTSSAQNAGASASSIDFRCAP